MISIQAAVYLVLSLIIGALVFGLLWWLVLFIGRRIPGEPGQWFLSVGQIVLAILAVLVLIGVLISLISGQPIFRP